MSHHQFLVYVLVCLAVALILIAAVVIPDPLAKVLKRPMPKGHQPLLRHSAEPTLPPPQDYWVTRGKRKYKQRARGTSEMFAKSQDFRAGEGWLNIYITREGRVHAGGMYPTKEKADQVAKPHRATVAHVRWEV